jgi:predicted alpha/beta-fold hydrolase
VDLRADSFIPAWWLPGRHAQTIGARATRSRRGVRLVRERLTAPDGDFLDLDWAETPAGRLTGAPLTVVLHGLEGSAASGYSLETYRQLAGRGVAAVGLNFRSCSGELNHAARLYHSGETGDLRYVIGVLARRFPGRPLAAVGFSLGGNVLLKYLGEEGQERQKRQGRQERQERQEGQSEAGEGYGAIVAAAAVSVPYDLAAGAAYTERGVARAYVWRLLRSLKRKVRARAGTLGDRIDLKRALGARTFREFDDAATAPLHGFAGADDYYRRSSSAAYLDGIRVPTRLIHAADDPFLPAEAFPRDAAARNPALDPCFTRRGGHVGFVSGPPWRRVYWAERMAAEHVARVAGGRPGVGAVTL